MLSRVGFTMPTMGSTSFRVNGRLGRGYLERDGRVTLCIDAESGDRVLVKGRASVVERPNVGGRWEPIAREMVLRYRGEEGLPYLEATRNEPRWLFFVTPTKITSWTGGGWAARYKHSAW